MSDHRELKRLAEAATAGPWVSGGNSVSTVRGNSVADCPRGDEEFIAAANPAAVLALIADLERTTAELKRMTESRKSVVRMKLDAQQELYQLKAENEALLEMLSKQIYERWSGEAGYVPWVRRGNSLRQDEARRIARSLMSKEG